MSELRFVPKGKIMGAIARLEQEMPAALSRLCRFLLGHQEEIPNLNLATIAKEANVGEATVVRLSKTLGFKGFHEFKLQLAIELSEKTSDEESIIDSRIEEDDPLKIVGRKIVNLVQAVLEENLDYLDLKNYQKVVDVILKAPKILILGMGNSGLCAEFFKNKLCRIGFNAMTESNTHFMYTAAALLHPGDVAIAISQKGSVYETVKGLKIAREAGATCVSITHKIKSYLARVTDYILFTGNQESFLQGDSLGTIVAQLHVCEILYVMIVQKNAQKAFKTKELTVKALGLKV